MIDIEQLWKRDSEVENFHAVISAFYDIMCNIETLPIDEIRELDDVDSFAYNCKCGNQHICSRSFWRQIFVALVGRTPDEQHPEYAEYKNLLKAFPRELDKISVRDYAEPYLRATEEGEYIKKAAEEVESAINSLIATLCSSPLAPGSRIVGNAVAAYKCPIHQTMHYLDTIDNKSLRYRLVSTPDEILEHLSPLSVRIVLRDMDAMRRKFNEKFPVTIISATKVKQIGNVIPVKAKKKGAAKNKTAVTEMKTSSKTVSIVDKSLYILTPNLMSQEWLIEFQVCGRKVPMTEEQAIKEAKLHLKKEVYFCNYGSHWHIGASSKKKSAAQTAFSGLFWYKKDPKRANRFVHRIMMEEF